MNYAYTMQEEAFFLGSYEPMLINHEPLHYLKMCYLDRVCYHLPAARCVVETVGADRVMFGTDAPPLTPIKGDGIQMIRDLNSRPPTRPRCFPATPRNSEDHVRRAASIEQGGAAKAACSLSPFLRGEGWGEGQPQAPSYRENPDHHDGRHQPTPVTQQQSRANCRRPRNCWPRALNLCSAPRPARVRSSEESIDASPQVFAAARTGAWRRARKRGRADRSDHGLHKGKTVTIVASGGVGGPIDLACRVVARFLSRHIPGNPTIVVRNMPGGGHVLMSNYMFTQAAKDGTYIGGVVNSIPTHQVIDGRGVRFDAGKFIWLGSTGFANLMTMAWHTAGFTTIKDVFERELLTGTTGVGSGTYMYTNAMNVILGTKFKMVMGYKDSASVDLAIERGEVQARGGMTLTGVKQERPHWVPRRKSSSWCRPAPRRKPNIRTCR